MRRLLFAFLLCLPFSAVAQKVATYTSVVIIGDSLSDTGDFYTSTGRIYPAPLTADDTVGRFTNGSDTSPKAQKYFGVWHEQLTGLLSGVPATQSFLLSGGTNHAFGDATSANGVTALNVGAGTINVRNMGQQVTDYLASAQPNSTTLFIVFGGANDFLQNPNANASDVAARITALVQRLVTAGAVNILVPNLPPLGDPTTQLGADTVAFNGILMGNLSALRSQYITSNPTVRLMQVDLFNQFGRIATNPAAYGFTDLTSIAQQQSATTNPDTFLSWDGLHPTTAGHFWIAQAACSAMAMTSTTLTASGNTLTAAVSNSGTLGLPVSSATPTGTVSFYSGVLTGTTYTYTLLGTGALNAQGQATLQGVAAGAYAVTAVYQGDSNFAAGCRTPSVAFTSTTAPTFTLSLSNSPATANVGAQVQTQVTVVPAAGFSRAVTISCGTLPQYVTCTVANSAITISGTTSTAATVTLQTATTASLDPRQPMLQFDRAPGIALALAPFALLLMRRRRSAVARLVAGAFLMCLSMTQLTGCGNSSPGSSSPVVHTTPAGTYTVPIIGTASDGTTSTANLSVTLR